MKLRIVTVPLVALVASLAITGVVVAQNPAGPQQPNANAGKSMKVGVVDIGVLFRDYKRKDTLEQAVNQHREQIKQELEADAEQIRRKRVNLDKGMFPVNSELWLQQRDEIKQAQFNLELKTERMQNVLKKKVEELTLQILTELEATIRAYGERHGFDLILKSDKQEEQPGAPQGELTQQFQERIFRAQISDVLFFNDSIEITESVKQLLNDAKNIARMDQLMKEREQRRQAAPAQTPAPTPPGTPGTGQPSPPPSAPPGANRGG